MESKQFDAALGGTEHLPFTANSLKFATSRSIEIAAMTESILRPSKTKLIFQTLPVHMRRRVMSHNAKRLPRKQRDGHLQQLKKSGFPPKQKRPSRKYRRRPKNLLEEYTRRQKKHVWLETHIWHAKRFHMVERWGHRLPLAPCDKAFRACYRASSKHCLMQDISYYTPFLITATMQDIKQLFSNISNTATGLSIAAKAYSNGSRQGNINLYHKNKYPYGYIGNVSFIWEPEKVNNSSKLRSLWIFVHPSQTNELEDIFTSLTVSNASNETSLEAPIKRMRLDAEHEKKQVSFNKHIGAFNRFRLTGPNSHAILVHTLKCIDNIEKIRHDKWVDNCKEEMKLQEKASYWEALKNASSPAELPSSCIMGLVVRDPRLSRPQKRTKAVQNEFSDLSPGYLINIPNVASASPLWLKNVRDMLKDKLLTNQQFIEHITKSQLVPGEVNVEDPALQSVPIILVQQPGSQDSTYKKLGYGCGWDIILPPKYALPFWHTFIMFGARTGGLREMESLHFESGICYLPPDTQAGQAEEDRIENELKDKYFRKPPSKRVNYLKLGINSPFKCEWRLLLKEWCDNVVNNYFVLRDRNVLDKLQSCLDKKSQIPIMDDMDYCLVPIYVKTEGRGNLKRHALICLPQEGDLRSKSVEEAPHHDVNEQLRKQNKILHKKLLKQMKRRRSKIKKSGQQTAQKTCQKKKKSQAPSEYVQKMRELWLPSTINAIRFISSRETMGYLHQGAFSFSEAKSCGVGYVAYNALMSLMKTTTNKVLVRNTCSRKYNWATIRIIK